MFGGGRLSDVACDCLGVFMSGSPLPELKTNYVASGVLVFIMNTRLQHVKNIQRSTQLVYDF